MLVSRQKKIKKKNSIIISDPILKFRKKHKYLIEKNKRQTQKGI